MAKKVAAEPAPLANVFVGKPEAPTDRDLIAELGPAKKYWDQLLTELAAECGLVMREWNCYSRKVGWSLRLQRRTRNIVYLSPHRGSFMASFSMGDKAIEAARDSELPKRVLKIISEAKAYPEGTAVRIEVSSSEDVEAVKKLAKAKLEN